MAINQVQVLAPQREERQAQQPKKDWWEKVMEGLQIAKGITGIASDYQTIQKYRTDRAMQQDKIDGRMNASELTELTKTHDLSDSPVVGAVRVLKRGEDGKDTPLFASVRKKQEPQDVISITTPGADGKPINKLVPKVAGAEYPAYEKPEKGPKDITVQERNTLQNQYDKDPEVRKTKTVLDSYASTQKLLTNPTPASDQALVYNYMKALDPNSVVRETEAETAAALGGLMERAKASYAKMAGEGMLTDAQRQDLATQIESLAQTAAERQAEIDASFTDLAGRRGVDTKDLRFVNRPIKPKGGETPPPPPAQHPQAAAAKAWAEKNILSPNPEDAAKAREILNRISTSPQNGSAKNG